MAADRASAQATVASLEEGGIDVTVTVPTYSGEQRLSLRVERDNGGDWIVFIPWPELPENLDQPLFLEGSGLEVAGGALYLGAPDEEPED
jgi:hypothetical protein